MQPSASARQVSSAVADPQYAPAWLLQLAGPAGHSQRAFGSLPAQARRPPVPQDISTPQAGQPETCTHWRTPPPGPQRLSPRLQAGTQLGPAGTSGARSGVTSAPLASTGSAAPVGLPPAPPAAPSLVPASLWPPAPCASAAPSLVFAPPPPSAPPVSPPS